MAKSIRSKWKRKCRAVKRERYSKKELERLKKTLGIDDTSKGNTDINMTEISKIVNVTSVKRNEEVNEDQMQVDTNRRIFNTKTLRDQHGTYPIWVHPRKIMKKKKSKKGKKGKKKN